MEELLNHNLQITVNSLKDALASSTSLFFFVFFLVVLFLQFYLKGVKKRGNNGKEHDGISRDKRVERIYGLNDIKGPKPFIPIKLIGNLPNLLPYTETLTKALQWDREFPGLMKITGGNETFIGMHSGPLAQQLFKTAEFEHNTKSSIIYGTMKPFITNGVLVSSGKFWQTQRKILMKSQSFQSMKSYMGMLNKHGQQFVQDLVQLFQDGKPHEINGIINVVFLKVISEMLFGYDGKSSTELDQYHHNFQTWKESLIKRLFNPWLLLNPLWKLHPMSKLQDKAVEEMFDFARRRIKERKEKGITEDVPSTNELKVENEKPNKFEFRTVVNELIDAGVEENQIVDEVNTMLFGGHETGATTIHFFCFLMALNPEIQEMCQKEIDELFEDPLLCQDGQITYEAAQSNLKYVERCLLEALRLFPPVFLFARKLNAPLKIELDNKTFMLPAGTNVACTPFLVHRNPENFPEPDKFDPDRFLPEEAAKRHAYAFIPFSGGPRNCLGMKFAMVEMKVMVTYLLRNFVMSTTDKMEDVPLLPYITLTPAKDYTFIFQARTI